MMVKDVREVRAVPIWLLREYLEGLGGESEGDGSIRGPGWTATLTQIEDFQVGSLRVGQVRLEIEGEEKALAELRPVLAEKLLRAGG
jgi:hypothetical protein